MNTLASSPALSAKRVFRFRLPVPVVLLWILLLPFAPLLLLVLLIACAVYGVNPFRAAGAFFQLFVSLRGTQVQVQSSQASIAISLF